MSNSGLILTTDHAHPMTLTFSTMLELGTPAPDFSLRDVVSGTTISLATFADKEALLVMFICRHCPFVRHVQNELARIGRDYAEYVRHRRHQLERRRDV